MSTRSLVQVSTFNCFDSEYDASGLGPRKGGSWLSRPLVLRSRSSAYDGYDGVMMEGKVGFLVRVEPERLNMHRLDCESQSDEVGRGSENSSRWKGAENFGRDG